MSTLVSLKQMAEQHANTVGKVTYFKIHPTNLHIEPGFNERDEGPELDAYIDAMKVAIRNETILPPLEVRVEDGKVFLVDGHCRARAYRELIAEGFPIQSVDVRKFEGDEAERTAHMLNSPQQRPLSMLEQGRAMKRLMRFGWSNQKIADCGGRSVSHVEQCLMLANANLDVQELVKSGAVAPKAALDALRKHGSAAGSFLKGIVGGGNKRVTAKDVLSPTLSPKLAARAATSMAGLFTRIGRDDLRTAEPDALIPVRAADLQALLAVHEAHEKKQTAKAARDSATAA